jgi:sugar phosphate isomerase/epimerase
MTPPRLSLAHLTVLDAGPLELIEAAIAGGFDAVGLRVVPPAPMDALVPVVGNEPLIRRILERLGDTALTVLDVESIWIGPATDVAELRPALEVGHRLGARNVLTMGNDPEEGRLTAPFARLCEEGARLDLHVGLEFAAFTHAASIQQAQRIVTAAGQPNGCVLVDALHLWRSGGTPEDVRRLDPRQLRYSQICDARGPRPIGSDALRREARGDRHYPGVGDIPLAAILDALPEDLPIAVEVPCAQDAGLPVAERARRCGEATRRFLDRYRRTPGGSV